VRYGLAGLVEYHSVDFVIANAENSAAGFGITREIGEQLLDYGIDVMTSGNHIWDKKEALDYIGSSRGCSARPTILPARRATVVTSHGRATARRSASSTAWDASSC